MPVSYDIWKRVGFFNLGAMERPEYALLVFRRHFDFAGMSKRPKGFTCLELGPGDSLSSALIGPAFGASQTYMVDVGSFANTDPATYHELAVYLRENALPVGDISKVRSCEAITGRLLSEIPHQWLGLAAADSVGIGRLCVFTCDSTASSASGVFVRYEGITPYPETRRHRFAQC
jgi:hypothetical protein